jgi:glycosyltransferase involved in cell wall biosynthesis
MNVSVIVSTYNQPAWLEKVLWGYSRQTYRDFELLIADDGSGEETAEVMRRVCAESGLRLRHVWHEDKGYRRSIVLNRAVLAARGDYLVWSDGDCIPRADFIERHVELARAGHFVSGGAVYLPLRESERITKDDILSGRFCDARWLTEEGWRPGRRALRFVKSQRLATLFDRLTPTAATWNLNNAATWKQAILDVNGMDNEMNYGGADRALGERLMNLGLKGIQARHRLLLVHLDHGRPYKTAESMRRNRENREQIRRERRVRAPLGIEELAPDPAAWVRSVPAESADVALR